MARRRTRAIFAIAACTTLSVGLAACGGDSDSDDESSGDKPVTLTWWHNGTACRYRFEVLGTQDDVDRVSDGLERWWKLQ